MFLEFQLKISHFYSNYNMLILNYKQELLSICLAASKNNASVIFIIYVIILRTFYYGY